MLAGPSDRSCLVAKLAFGAMSFAWRCAMVGKRLDTLFRLLCALPPGLTRSEAKYRLLLPICFPSIRLGRACSFPVLARETRQWHVAARICSLCISLRRFSGTVACPCSGMTGEELRLFPSLCLVALFPYYLYICICVFHTTGLSQC